MDEPEKNLGRMHLQRSSETHTYEEERDEAKNLANWFHFARIKGCPYSPEAKGRRKEGSSSVNDYQETGSRIQGGGYNLEIIG